MALSLDPTSIPHASASQILGFQMCTIKARFGFKFRYKCHPWLRSLCHLAPPTSVVLLLNEVMCCLPTLATDALSLQWSLARGLGTGVFAWLLSLLPLPSQRGSPWLWSRTRIMSYRNRCSSEVLPSVCRANSIISVRHYNWRLSLSWSPSYASKAGAYLFYSLFHPQVLVACHSKFDKP